VTDLSVLTLRDLYKARDEADDFGSGPVNVVVIYEQNNEEHEYDKGHSRNRDDISGETNASAWFLDFAKTEVDNSTYSLRATATAARSLEYEGSGSE
jgi:hypothetical protein